MEIRALRSLVRAIDHLPISGLHIALFWAGHGVCSLVIPAVPEA